MTIDPLDQLLEESVAAITAERRAKDARRRVTKLSSQDPKRAELLEEIRHFDETRLWDNLSNVAVIQERLCACGSIERWMRGWFRKQTHRHLSATFRLTAGALPGLSSSVEVHQQPGVSWCSSCVERRVAEMQ